MKKNASNKSTKKAPAAQAGVAASPAFFRYRYLMGAMQQNQLAMTVRLSCVPDDVNLLPEIIQAWGKASARMVELTREEAGAPDEIVIDDVPATLRSRLDEINNDSLFRASFSDMPTGFQVVDIDKLVAPQRDVNLDYVDTLRKRIPGKSVKDLLEFCVGPRTEPPELKVLQTALNTMTFSSRSLDLRFLGGFPKPISEDEIKVAYGGGQPAEVVTLLIGYGAAPINAWLVGRRLVLGNGFHRIVAMRLEGILQVPILVKRVSNADIEFPDQVLGLSRAYLLGSPRPVLVKDFFDNVLTVELKLKPRRKVL